MNRTPTPAAEPVGRDGFTPTERTWLQAVHRDLAGFWPTVRDLVVWLDEQNGRSDHETAMRLMKLTEEAGEVVQAYVGVTGQNPRKGDTHKPADVAGELCDVIVTAAVALHQWTDDPAGTLAAKLRKIAERAGRTGAVAS